MGLAKKIANKIIDALLGALSDILGGAFDWVIGKLAGAVGLLVTPVGELMVFAPTPRPIGQLGQRPTNSPWGTLYDAFWADMVPLALLLLLVSYLVRQAAATFGIGNVAGQRHNQRGVIIGLVLIPSSWYLAMLLLQLFNALTRAVSPNMTNLSGILNQVAASGNGLSALFAAGLMLSASATVYGLVLLLNVVRIAGVFTLVYALPVLIAFDLGQFPYVGTISRRLMAMLPTLAFLPLPTAIGLRLSLLIFGQNGGLRIEGLPASPLLNSIFLLAPGLLGIAVPFLVFRTAPFGKRLSAMGGFSTNDNLQRGRNATDGRNLTPDLGVLRGRFARSAESSSQTDSDENSSGRTVPSQTGGLPTRAPSPTDRPELPPSPGDPVSTDGGGPSAQRRARSDTASRRPSFIATTDGYVVETTASGPEQRSTSPTDTTDAAEGVATPPTDSSGVVSTEAATADSGSNDPTASGDESDRDFVPARRTADPSEGSTVSDGATAEDSGSAGIADDATPDPERDRQTAPESGRRDAATDQSPGGASTTESTGTTETAALDSTTDSTPPRHPTPDETETDSTTQVADESQAPDEIDGAPSTVDDRSSGADPDSSATPRRTPGSTERGTPPTGDDDSTAHADSDDDEDA